PAYVRAFRHNHTPAAPNSRFGTQAANVGGSAPPWPTAFDSWNIRRSTKVVARHTATPQAMPLRGVEIASGAPNSATMMQANGTDSLSACSTRSFLVSEPERASASTRKLRSEEHTSELQSRGHLVCRLLLEKKNNKKSIIPSLIRF